MVKNGPKRSKVDPHSQQIIQNGPNGQNIYFFNRLKMVKSVSKPFKMVKFVKWSIKVRFCPKQFKMVQKGFKWSNNFQ